MKVKRNVKNSKIPWMKKILEILYDFEKNLRKSRFKPEKAGLNRVLTAGLAFSWKSRLFANPGLSHSWSAKSSGRQCGIYVPPSAVIQI